MGGTVTSGDERSTNPRPLDQAIVPFFQCYARNTTVAPYNKIVEDFLKILIGRLFSDCKRDRVRISSFILRASGKRTAQHRGLRCASSRSYLRNCCLLCYPGGLVFDHPPPRRRVHLLIQLPLQYGHGPFRLPCHRVGAGVWRIFGDDRTNETSNAPGVPYGIPEASTEERGGSPWGSMVPTNFRPTLHRFPGCIVSAQLLR